MQNCKQPGLKQTGLGTPCYSQATLSFFTGLVLLDSQKRLVRGYKFRAEKKHTILTQVMADELNFLWSQIVNYTTEADADIPNSCPRPLESHGRRRSGVSLSPRLGALFVADLIVGMENKNYIRDAEADLIAKKLE